MMNQVVIVGASIAGLRAAEALRREGYSGSLRLVGEERDGPYQRPPLSKNYLLGTSTEETLKLPLRADLDIELFRGYRIDSVDFGDKVLVSSDNRRMRFDGLVIATGATTRTLSNGRQLDGVYSLRTLTDAQAIRSLLLRQPKVVVVGAGFIGCEVAATCRQLGLNVTVVEPFAVPMERVLGSLVGGFLSEVHVDHGTKLLMGVKVQALEGTTHVTGVRLDTGLTIPADLVIEGLGARPATDWLKHSGLMVDNGVLCDERCRALGVDGVVAAGDVANWWHPHFGKIRFEHWENAVLQGEAAAHALLHGNAAKPYAPVPFFWSDQYDIKIQLVGIPAPDDLFSIIEGSMAERKFLGVYGRPARPNAALAVNMPGSIHHYRNRVACASAAYA